MMKSEVALASEPLLSEKRGRNSTEQHRMLPSNDAPMHRSVYERFDLPLRLSTTWKPYRPGTLRNHVDFGKYYTAGSAFPSDLAIDRRRVEEEGLVVRGYRFQGDTLCRAARFETLRRELGDGFVGRTLPDSAGNPNGRKPPHSVFTTDLIDAQDEPTRAAVNEVIAFFRERLPGQYKDLYIRNERGPDVGSRRGSQHLLAISGSDLFAITPTGLGFRRLKLRNFHSEIQQNDRDF